MVLLNALFLALACMVGAFLLQLKIARDRRARLKGLTLKPNCLLTRHPIAFLAGAKSVYHVTDHWNEIPAYLREHGYDVLVIEPPTSGDPISAILKALEELGTGCHLVADTSLEPELAELAKAKPRRILTLTQVCNRATRASKKSSLMPWPLWTQSRSTEALKPEDLKPLDTAVAHFELEPIPVSARAKGWIAASSQVFLWLHNLASLRRRPAIDAIETGVVMTEPPWQNESRFLDLAISLAERDLQWSD